MFTDDLLESRHAYATVSLSSNHVKYIIRSIWVHTVRCIQRPEMDIVTLLVNTLFFLFGSFFSVFFFYLFGLFKIHFYYFNVASYWELVWTNTLHTHIHNKGFSKESTCIV